MAEPEKLLEKLVLKGGNALSLLHGVGSRSSIDLDYSMEEDLTDEGLKEFEDIVEKSLKKHFLDMDLVVFEFRVDEKPKVKKVQKWGGYMIQFKLMDKNQFENFNPERLMNRPSAAIPVNGDKKIFKIDVSCFEYCDSKTHKELDSYYLSVYTLEAIVLEKIRALCQSTPAYKDIIPTTNPKGRSRDFIDIFNTVSDNGIDLSTPDNVELGKRIFKAKSVPLDFINLIGKDLNRHEENFVSVLDTVTESERAALKDFSFYADFVLGQISILKEAWNV